MAFPGTRIKKIHPLFFIISVCGFLLSCGHDKPAPAKHHLDKEMLTQAQNYFSLYEYERGIKYFDSAYAAIPHKDMLDIWSHYSIKGQYYYWAKPNPRIARLYVDSMFAILKDHEKDYGIEYVRTLMLNGDILMTENKYSDALDAFYAGSLFAEKNLDPCSSVELSTRMGMIKFHQKEYRHAISYLKRSIVESASCPLETRVNQQAWALGEIAVYYDYAHLLDSAIFYDKAGLDKIDNSISLVPKQSTYLIAQRGYLYGNLGSAYIVLKDYALAENYLKKSIDINNRPGYNVHAAKDAQMLLAEIYIRRARTEEANDLLQMVENDLNRRPSLGGNNYDLALKLLATKREYYDSVKNTEAAYEAFKRFHFLRDSLSAVNKNQAAQDLDEGLKQTAQHDKIQLLSKNNELKTTYLSAVIVFSVLILIILMMAWYSLKRSRKNVYELTNLNKLISDYNLQMQSALTALEQSYEENANIIKIVAHDLRAPIGGITIAVSRMLEKSDWSENDQSTLRLIQNSGKDSLALVSDLLTTHSRPKEIKKEPVDMYLLLVYCVSFMRLKAEEKGQKIELDAGHFTVFVNRGNIWRVICNLIANAIKFSPPDTTIKVLMLKKEDNVLITVDDCGIGIPDNMHDKIFDMFTEAKRQGTTGEQPFGIGLAISKQIVEMHGGKIWFEGKKPVNGTMFHVELPIQYLN
ncbi:MAG TPA: tetratricopeptide repeat-containing sensor histidine kinase [Mucilaginibacter sp.]|nr:tetratricopeptide repeat-containing sensor histidine kinase [Mucilaginibacter sp.]